MAKYVKPKGNPGVLRPVAILLWVLGIVCEVLGILIALGKIITPIDPFILIIAALVLDAILVITGSFLWKRANKIDPPSEKNQIEFFLKTQLGSIIAIIAFLPILIILLTNKDLDKKTKTWASALAAILLVCGSLLSADWNPISLEDVQQMEINAANSEFGVGEVQWSKNSKVYHTWKDCHALKSIHDENRNEGNVKAASEAGKVRMCYVCAEHFDITEGVEAKTK